MTFVAALPILLALALLVGLRWPAVVAMPICAVATTVACWWLWQVPPIRIAASIVEAGWVTVSILMIVFGALFFLGVLRQTRAIDVLQRSVSGLSGDPRIQAVLIGWTLGSFLEGSAGFGAPAAITAPLLIGLGFRPLQAVVVALVGDSTAVSFGAIGTPMLIGFGQGLENVDGAPAVHEIAVRIATLDIFLGTLMPAMVVATLVVSSKGIGGWRNALPAVPFACLVGLGQSLTSLLVVVAIGPELPSLIGPIAGFAVAMVLLRFGWLVPRESAAVANLQSSPLENEATESTPSIFRSLAPYVLLVVLLVVTRLRALPIGTWLSAQELGVEDLFGTGISAQIQPLYSPGAAFVVCALISGWFLRADGKQLAKAARTAGRTTLKTAVALVAAIITVRLFLQSGGNDADLHSMPMVLAETLAGTLGGLWQGIAPCVGSLGSFMSGSATFSNMLFALLQFQIATELGYDATTILALQGIGSAAGNMTCIHNVVAACAVADTLGEEGNVLRRTAVPMIIYLVVAGVLGLFV